MVNFMEIMGFRVLLLLNFLNAFWDVLGTWLNRDKRAISHCSRTYGNSLWSHSLDNYGVVVPTCARLTSVVLISCI